MSAAAPSAWLSEFAAEVRAGLTVAGQKTLPCRYFYDAVGSALFEVITELPEYGLTRAEDRIIAVNAGRMAGFRRVVELGSGSGTKTRNILEALGAGVTYHPVDVSRAALSRCARELSEVAEVIPIEALYVTGLARALSYRSAGERLLVLFLGSTIGNFDRPAAGDFLSTIRGYLDAGDALLLGADLADSEPRLLAAYDDAIGVTAAFNLNLLARINRDLRGDFRVRSFAHEVRYDRRERRIEMHLRSRRAQEVHIREAGIAVHFEAGETIWTESSHKFSLEEVRAMAIRSGFDCVEQWVDREWPFADSLLVSRR